MKIHIHTTLQNLTEDDVTQWIATTLEKKHFEGKSKEEVLAFAQGQPLEFQVLNLQKMQEKATGKIEYKIQKNDCEHMGVPTLIKDLRGGIKFHCMRCDRVVVPVWKEVYDGIQY